MIDLPRRMSRRQEATSFSLEQIKGSAPAITLA
jgi:hypothetical protein